MLTLNKIRLATVIGLMLTVFPYPSHFLTALYVLWEITAQTTCTHIFVLGSLFGELQTKKSEE